MIKDIKNNIEKNIFEYTMLIKRLHSAAILSIVEKIYTSNDYLSNKILRETARKYASKVRSGGVLELEIHRMIVTVAGSLMLISSDKDSGPVSFDIDGLNVVVNFDKERGFEKMKIKISLEEIVHAVLVFGEGIKKKDLDESLDDLLNFYNSSKKQ